jgi:hypothetical protein
MNISGIPREEFRDRLVYACGGCAIQHDGWPCGTCFLAVFDNGEDWRAVLAYRGDYDSDISGSNIRMAVALKRGKNGTIGHVMKDVPLKEVRSRVRNIWKQLKKGDK